MQGENITDVSAWLRELGLEAYEAVFRENAIDADVLADLTDAHLKEIGIPLGHRVKLMKAAAALCAPPLPGPATRDDAALTAEGEWRQVAVLFADLAGYTALSNEIDAEEVHAVLSAFFDRVDQIVAEHGGRIDKHIGDCVMAVFGAPVAHGNDAERAVRAGLAVRDVMPEVAASTGRAIDVHVGVSFGQVVASGTGSEHHREYTVTGDSVNLASRLTDAAEAGEILVSDMVRQAMDGRLDCVDSVELAAKGFAEPVRAWRVRGLRTDTATSGPFVGRRHELRQIRVALDACRHEGAGQSIYLRGEAGIGKTRLVDEARRLADESGFAVHTSFVLDFGTARGRDAVRLLLRSLLGLSPGDAADVLKAALMQAEADGLVAGDQEMFFNDLLEIPQPAELGEAYAAMDNASREEGKREALARLVERKSLAQPLFLVVEDVHWADRSALAYLARLTACAADSATILLMTSRLEGDPMGQAGFAGMISGPLTTLDLSALRPEEARSLAEALFAVDAGLAEQCLARAEGNPLFLEQLLRLASESTDAAVPGSVQSLVQARIDRLRPEDKAALQVASVLGQQFDAEALAYILEDADYDLERLVGHLLIRPHDQGYLFAHALIRDSVYDTLLKRRRLLFHRRAAEWFAGEDVVLHAEHLDRAEDPGAPAAYREAAAAELAEYRYEAALLLAKRGLALATDDARKFELACLEGDIHHDMGDMPAALGAYEAALGVAGNETDKCRAWIGLAAVRRVTDDLDGAFADLESAMEVAHRHGLTAIEARIHYLRGNLLFPRGDIDGCLKAHRKGLELARMVGSSELEAAALGGLGDAEYVRGRMISAHDHLNDCVTLARENGFGRIEVANLAQIAHTLLYFRSQEEALEQARTVIAAAARIGHARAELNARVASIFALHMLGRADSCREEVERAQALVRRLGAWRFEQNCQLYLGRLLLEDGRRREAIEHLQQALEVSRRTGITFHGPQILGSLGLALEEPEARVEALKEGEAIIDGGCVGHNQLRFYPDAMRVAWELSDYGAVERYTAALESFTAAEPLPWADVFVAHGRVLAALGTKVWDDDLRRKIGRLRKKADALGLRAALETLPEP